MRVLFAGSPEVALPTLQAIHSSRHALVGVLSQPARPVGRKKVLTPTAVARHCEASEIPLATPNSAVELREAVGAWEPDIAIVIAYGRILGQEELALVPKGWWNVHFSLLPRWRGAAPVPYALAEGDSETGLSIFRIEEGLDTGPIAASLAHPIAPHDTSQTLLTKLSELAPDPVLELLDQAEAQDVVTEPQRGTPSYAPKPSGDVGELTFSDPAGVLYNRYRAWRDEPGCFVRRDDNGQRVKIMSAWVDPDHGALRPGELAPVREGVAVGTSTTALILSKVQPAGKAVMDAGDWLRGLPGGIQLRA